MDRRTLPITVLGSTLTAPALEWLIARAPDDLARTSGHPLPVQTVDHLDAITASLRRLDDQLGEAAALELIQTHLDTVTQLAKNRRYDETVGRRLHAAAGELLRLAGWVSFDAGRHAQAQRYWYAGLREAHAAGDTGLGANILGCLSCQAKDLGAYTEAVTLAEAARTKYPGTSPRVSAILDLRAAEAYANTGSAADTARCIDDAFSHLADPAPTHGDPAWSYWIDTSQTHAQAGYCHLTLEDWQPARSHLQQALNLQGPDVVREGALRTTLLASTYARQPSPDLDQALALGNQAIDTLDGTVDSARCVGHVQRLTQHLHPHRRHTGVRELADRVGLSSSLIPRCRTRVDPR